MMIRPEREGDEEAIGRVTEAAFREMEFSDQTEHLIVDRLRKAVALAISLVAEDSDGIVGHVGFSPVNVTNGQSGWFALGPLSVLPERQGQGIGSLLVKEGLAALERINASGCVVAGDPDYYGRFGFEHPQDLAGTDVPYEYFTVFCLRGAVPSGIVQFHPGFYNDAP